MIYLQCYLILLVHAFSIPYRAYYILFLRRATSNLQLIFADVDKKLEMTAHSQVIVASSEWTNRRKNFFLWLTRLACVCCVLYVWQGGQPYRVTRVITRNAPNAVKCKFIVRMTLPSSGGPIIPENTKKKMICTELGKHNNRLDGSKFESSV